MFWAEGEAEDEAGSVVLRRIQSSCPLPTYSSTLCLRPCISSVLSSFTRGRFSSPAVSCRMSVKACRVVSLRVMA